MKYLIYLFWLTIYSRSAAIRGVLKAISKTQRNFLLILVGLLVVGQLSQSKYPVYPLVYWGMYSEIDEKGSVYSFSGVRRDGSEFRLPMTDLVRSHSKRLVWRLRSLASEIRKSTRHDERLRAEELFDRTVRAAWQLYRERSSAEEIVAVRVRRIVVDLRDYRGPEELRTKLFREVAI